uniref:Uncharacterized protein n=1 Tax=Tanacetum cinerariifolium TaxID=118510 RepID=A0A699IUA7_TANCI|nr:hypothetical protein [Tanacetum cinerariifolium]
MSLPPRVPPPPLTQESGSMDITLTLSPITLLDIQFITPSPLFGHPISWNLLEAHGATCLCCINNRSLSLEENILILLKGSGNVVSLVIEWKKGVESDGLLAFHDHFKVFEFVLEQVDALLDQRHLNMKYLVKIRKQARILKLETKTFEDYCSDIQYAVSIKEDTAYLCLHFTKDHKG